MAFTTNSLGLDKTKASPYTRGLSTSPGSNGFAAPPQTAAPNPFAPQQQQPAASAPTAPKFNYPTVMSSAPSTGPSKADAWQDLWNSGGVQNNYSAQSAAPANNTGLGAPSGSAYGAPAYNGGSMGDVPAEYDAMPMSTGWQPVIDPNTGLNTNFGPMSIPQEMSGESDFTKAMNGGGLGDFSALKPQQPSIPVAQGYGSSKQAFEEEYYRRMLQGMQGPAPLSSRDQAIQNQLNGYNMNNPFGYGNQAFGYQGGMSLGGAGNNPNYLASFNNQMGDMMDSYVGLDRNQKGLDIANINAGVGYDQNAKTLAGIGLQTDASKYNSDNTLKGVGLQADASKYGSDNTLAGIKDTNQTTLSNTGLLGQNAVDLANTTGGWNVKNTETQNSGLLANTTQQGANATNLQGLVNSGQLANTQALGQNQQDLQGLINSGALDQLGLSGQNAQGLQQLVNSGQLKIADLNAALGRYQSDQSLAGQLGVAGISAQTQLGLGGMDLAGQLAGFQSDLAKQQGINQTQLGTAGMGLQGQLAGFDSAENIAGIQNADEMAKVQILQNLLGGGTGGTSAGALPSGGGSLPSGGTGGVGGSGGAQMATVIGGDGSALRGNLGGLPPEYVNSQLNTALGRLAQTGASAVNSLNQRLGSGGFQAKGPGYEMARAQLQQAPAIEAARLEAQFPTDASLSNAQAMLPFMQLGEQSRQADLNRQLQLQLANLQGGNNLLLNLL